MTSSNTVDDRGGRFSTADRSATSSNRQQHIASLGRPASAPRPRSCATTRRPKSGQLLVREEALQLQDVIRDPLQARIAGAAAPTTTAAAAAALDARLRGLEISTSLPMPLEMVEENPEATATASMDQEEAAQAAGAIG
ncbi:hypothetical protein SLS58_009346 [Diplodia intermedia]|uniref:Uncharacterized protein n=1 Tax=Diplodia intermedia TaxID=856260 RepID=A0ABR3TCW3_9PEZI